MSNATIAATDRTRAGLGAVVLVRGLRKAYRGQPAVDGIDLDIAPGEIFALLGPNGAGKTTTIAILTGQLARDAGTVEVLGRDPADAGRGPQGRSWRARTGIVAQSAGIIPELTVAELVRHIAGFYPAPRDPAEVIALTGLAGKAGSRIGTLSGGQARRLDVALAVVGRPELLFLDEPTTGFDPAARRQFWQLIRRLSEDGTTILLTTHYLDEAEALATRIAVIKAGRIVAGGAPAELRGRHDGTATVSWDTPQGRRREQTAAPTRLVAELAPRFGGEVPGLTVSRPTLEDIYLRLIEDGSQASEDGSQASEDGSPASEGGQ
jgi:ABC-2 type transport system ATP-binding protein